jgi:hypothetical protein
MTKAKTPKMSKEERKQVLAPFEELQNQGFDASKFEKKAFGKEITVNDEEIQKYFSETTNNENPAKELFEVRGDIRTRTELTKKQVSSVVKLKYLSNELMFPELSAIAENFMYCQVSKDRKSRAEFVDTMKGQNEMNQGGGFFSKFRGLFGGQQ